MSNLKWPQCVIYGRIDDKNRRSSECNFVALWFNLPTCDCDSSGFMNDHLFPFSGQSCESHFCLAEEHSVSDVTIWTLNSPGMWHVPAETCYKQPYLHGLFSVGAIGFVKLSLYESCIRSSVPISYWLFISQTEWKRSFVSNPCFSDSISFGFIMPKSLWGCEVWLVIFGRTAAVCSASGVCEGRRGGCSTAYSTSHHIGRLQSRQEGWQTATLSLHQSFITDGRLRMLLESEWFTWN